MPSRSLECRNSQRSAPLVVEHASELPRRVDLAVGLLLLVLSISGCSDQHLKYSVNVDQARETLVVALDGWRRGQSPGDLQGIDPAIVVQDADWLAGARLLAYEVDPEVEPQDANLMARVRLTLKGRDGRKSTKTVRYVVGTAPSLTVLRAAM
jgi:hypothetical protein